MVTSFLTINEGPTGQEVPVYQSNVKGILTQDRQPYTHFQYSR